MPSTQKPKRQPEQLVELAPGVNIPALFETTYPTDTGSWTVRVQTGADGVPRCLDRAEHVSGSGQPVAEMTDEHWRRRCEFAIARQASRVASSRMMDDAGVSWA